MAVDSLESTNYTEHLSRVNKEKKVVSSEDICNQQGTLLVKKGTAVDDKIAFLVAKHKLQKPIAHSISIEDMIGKGSLLQSFSEFFDSQIDVAKIHKQANLSDALIACCEYVCKFSLLLQKLTVMKTNMPELFDKTIAGAWFTLAISEQLIPDKKICIELFVAALSRDLGMLHLKTVLLEKNETLTNEEWRAMQSHTILSKLVIEDIGMLPKSTIRAVLEHHERSDGAGYPKGKHLEALSTGGQIVAMSDTIQAVLINKFGKSGHKLGHLEGFLNINISTYSEPVYKATIRLIRLLKEPPPLMVDESKMSQLIQDLVRRNKKYLAIFSALERLQSLLPTTEQNQQELLLTNFIKRLTSMQIGSGIPSKDYDIWMKHVDHNNITTAYSEIEMTSFMYDEIQWQLNQIYKYIEELSKLPVAEEEKRLAMSECATLISEASISNG